MMARSRHAPPNPRMLLTGRMRPGLRSGAELRWRSAERKVGAEHDGLQLMRSR